MSKIDEQILAIALKPYAAKNARYLVSAHSLSPQQQILETEGLFSILSSSYVENTGHFNAAEFIICANQLLATSLAQRLFQKHGDAGLDGFSERYNSCFITETTQSFRRIIDPTRFRGIVKTTKTRSRGEYMFSDIDISFGDSAGADKANGRIRVAVPKTILALS